MDISSKEITVGILGASGLLGSNLCKHLSSRYTVEPITRENYKSKKGRFYDVLVNANGNSRRFWANEHPLEDFEASTESVYQSLFDFKFKKYVYISSPDVYINPSNPETTTEETAKPGVRSTYGLNKFLSEQIVINYAGSYIIIRPSAILGDGLKKGPIFDMMNNNPLFITSDSYLQFITTIAVAECITELVDGEVSNEIFNIAGSGHTTVSELGDIIGREIKISSGATLQQYEMNVEKVLRFYSPRTSNEYVRDYLENRPS